MNLVEWRFLARFAPFGQFLARFAAGAMLAAHGYYKFHGGTGHFAEGLAEMGVPSPETAAVLSAGAELVGGSLMALGFLTRPAAFLVSFNMAVAIYLSHRTQFGLIGTRDGTHIELALAILVVGLATLFQGGGAVSLDRALGLDRSPQSGPPPR